MLKNIISNKHWVIVPTVIAALVGCGADEGNPATPPSGVELKANNALGGVIPGEQSFVNLAAYVQKGSHIRTTITDVTSLNSSNDCGEAEIDQKLLGFSTTVTGKQRCEYNYTVEGVNSYTGESQSQSAKVLVLSSSAPKPTLTPIGHAAELANGTVTTVVDIFKVLTEQGEIITQDDVLADDFHLIGDGDVKMNEPSAGLMTFTTTKDQLHRVLYSIEDTAGTEHRYGNVDIAVSTGVNSPLIVEPYSVYPDIVEINDTVEIDISQYVQTEDGDDYGLVSVRSVGNNVEIKNPNEPHSKVIIVNPTKHGDFEISYVVSDFKGGLGVGVIKLTVSNENLQNQWDPIFMDLSKEVAFAPLTKSDADNMGLTYKDLFFDTSSYDDFWMIRIDDKANAINICNRFGRIAKLTDFEQIYNKYDVNKEYFWPVGHAYLAEGNDGTLVSFDMTTGNVESNAIGYLSCVTNPMVIDLLIGDIKADGVSQAKFVVSLDNQSGDKLENVHLKASTSNNKGDFVESELVTDANGQAEFAFYTTQAGLSSIYVESEYGHKGSLFVNASASLLTARVESIELIKDNALANSNDINTIKVLLVDEFYNPIRNAKINFDYPSDFLSLIKHPNQLVTGVDGFVNVDFQGLKTGVFPIVASIVNDSGELSEVSIDTSFIFPELMEHNSLMYSGPLGVEALDSSVKFVNESMYNPKFTGFEIGLASNNVLVSLCEQLTYQNYDDWRALTVAEMQSLRNTKLEELKDKWPLTTPNSWFMSNTGVYFDYLAGKTGGGDDQTQSRINCVRDIE
ncbi:hypothetical protein QNE29_004357 [Vibrio vulnificus]|nr:hypothetical protein [Vibrio vulnificus]